MRREQRLRKRAEFDAVFSTKVRVSHRELSVAVRDRGDDAPSRWGFAVGSRLGGAVVRNRIKRRLRHIAAQIGGSGLDIVVIARSGADEASYQMLKQNLMDLMKQAREQLERPSKSRAPRRKRRSSE